jgi:hypothetical protein
MSEATGPKTGFPVRQSRDAEVSGPITTDGTVNLQTPASGAAAHASTSTNGTPDKPRPPGWRGWDAGVRATVIGTVAGVLGLVIAIAAWQWPRSPADPPTNSSTTTTATATASRNGTTATAKSSPEPARYLAGSGFPAESGGAFLVSVPRALANTDDFADHPIAISCPSNETGDKVHDVTFALNGHYLQFDATVRPYYPKGVDAQTATFVTALIGIRQSDGTLRISQAGIQQSATPATAQSLSASVENAEKLTLRVQCGYPTGTITLTGARLTPA